MIAGSQSPCYNSNISPSPYIHSSNPVQFNHKYTHQHLQLRENSHMFPNHEDSQFPSSSPCAPHDFLAVPDFMMRRSVSFSGLDRPEELHQDDEMSDDGSQILGEKKRRLNMEQVRALEKSFELGNKLEPERKTELARALGLQPRQIAIWFQNRRARWKTKQLEMDYDVLKRQFEALKADNEELKAHNNKLQDQLLALKTSESTPPINLNKDHECSWSNGSDHSCDVNLNTPISTDNNLIYPHQTGKHHGGAILFPPANTAASSLTQLLHGSSRPNHLNHISQKMGGHHHPHHPAASASASNLFGSIEENPDFWPWTDQTSFH